MQGIPDHRKMGQLYLVRILYWNPSIIIYSGRLSRWPLILVLLFHSWIYRMFSLAVKRGSTVLSIMNIYCT